MEIPNFEEFPNLEKLNLEGCEKLEKLDPSIGLLTKIVYLNLEDCKSLISIPNTIFGISSLKYIIMRGCSKLSFYNPGPMNIVKRASHSQSTSIFKCTTLRMIPYTPILNKGPRFYLLNEIDISFCGLRQLPDAIGCLHQLQRLKLGGNNFVSLPSMNELSKLVYLNLDQCMFLESLPQLPFPTAINWGTEIFYGKIGLDIFYCPKLGEREYIIAFSWMKQFIQANPQYPHAIDIVIPGSEIPSWFNNQSEGDTILIDNSPIKHVINNDIVGFLCCSLFSVEPSTDLEYSTLQSIYVQIVLHLAGFYMVDDWCLTSRNNFLEVVLKNHIWLAYFPRKLSWYGPDFHGTMDVKFDNYPGWVSKEVKNCGYAWVHKQDLQEFNLTMMHPVDSLALKFKSLTIEDEAQQQPQPHSFI